MLDENSLKKILPCSTPKIRSIYLPLLIKYMTQYEINTKLRISAFIAQIGHESGSLVYTKELASGDAYEGRKDLGNVQKGDGRKYKGRGLIQITGRNNYSSISSAFGIDFLSNPELLEQPEYAVKSACWWWKTHGLNELSDRGEFLKITKVINGGTNGLLDRQSIYNRALTNLN